jgi:hypothetical protein
MLPNYYAGIGSRKTPETILEQMQSIAEYLDSTGYILRSGAAEGADKWFELGAKDKEIFLPWKEFNGNSSGFYPPSEQAQVLAHELLSYKWKNLSHGAKLLHSRNCHQVLGPDLDTPVDFVLCWTPDGAENECQLTSKSGGTGTAILLASKFNIPVINMKNLNWRDKFQEVLSLNPFQ